MIARLSLVACVLLAARTSAQDLEKLDELEQVVQAAVAKAAPFVVTVETFGGLRKKLDAGPGAKNRDGNRPEPESRPQSGSRPSSRQQSRPNQPPKKDPGKLVMEGFLQAQGATTGVVLSEDGWVLASRFALNFDPTTILVTLPDGKSFEARRVGEDKSRGLALLKIEATGLPVPTFVDPKDVVVGSWAIALGRTFGKRDPSVHMGVVSAKARQLGRAVQTDAWTSPANYGGPLIDIEGRVFGIVVPLSSSGEDAGADMYDSGIGFAATIADIRPLLERMQEGEVLHRGWLGVATRPDDLGPGALLSDVAAGAPARAAGLQKGDRVVEVDGVAVKNSFHLQTLIGAKLAGDAVHLKVKRKGQDEALGMTVFLANPALAK